MTQKEMYKKANHAISCIQKLVANTTM